MRLFIVLLHEIDLPYFSKCKRLLVLEITFNFIKYLSAFRDILDCFTEFSLYFIRNADIVQDSSIV
jgi:hypothetical protein